MQYVCVCFLLTTIKSGAIEAVVTETFFEFIASLCSAESMLVQYQEFLDMYRFITKNFRDSHVEPSITNGVIRPYQVLCTGASLKFQRRGNRLKF